MGERYERNVVNPSSTPAPASSGASAEAGARAVNVAGAGAGSSSGGSSSAPLKLKLRSAYDVIESGNAFIKTIPIGNGYKSLKYMASQLADAVNNRPRKTVPAGTSREHVVDLRRAVVRTRHVRPRLGNSVDYNTVVTGDSADQILIPTKKTSTSYYPRHGRLTFYHRGVDLHKAVILGFDGRLCDLKGNRYMFDTNQATNTLPWLRSTLPALRSTSEGLIKANIERHPTQHLAFNTEHGVNSRRI